MRSHERTPAEPTRPQTRSSRLRAGRVMSTAYRHSSRVTRYTHSGGAHGCRLVGHVHRAASSRTRSCWRRRRRPNPTATSCARSRPAGAASSPRPSACIRSSTSPGRRPSSSAPTPTRTACRWRSAPDTALHSSWNWELISDKPLDWWLPRLARIKQAHPDRDPRRLDHGRVRQRPRAAPLADAGDRVPGRRRRRVRAEPVVPAHGPRGHGLEHRQGRRAHLGRHAGRERSGEGAGLVQAHAVDDRHRRRSARRRF